MNFAKRQSYRARCYILATGMTTLTVMYFLGYLHNSARPSPSAPVPKGWWGWFDQSKYLQSAQALAQFDLSPSSHWYPLGYAILGAPFVWMGYNLYLIPDLVCLLITASGIVFFAEGLGVSTLVAMLIAIGTTMFPGQILDVWVEPWNTTLSAALIWWSLALGTRLTLLRHEGRLAEHRIALFFLLGALLVLIPVTRPTDLLISALFAGYCFLTVLWNRELRWNELLAATTGAAIICVPIATLYVQIYGFRPSEYMIHSRQLGFRTALLWWKTYLLLITPRPWFPDGEGLMERMHWLFFGITGIVMLPWTVRTRKDLPYVLLAALCVSYSLLFFSYSDLIPAGLWRYNNVHYFKWALPAMGLLAWYGLRILFSSRWRMAVAVVGGVFLVSCIRILPIQVPNGASHVWMLTRHETPPAWRDSYFSSLAIEDRNGQLLNIHDFRSLPDSQGERWIALARPFDGKVRDLAVNDPSPISVISWDMKLTLRPDPCWLPPYACRYKAPHP